jgi:hypothetical protein
MKSSDKLTSAESASKTIPVKGSSQAAGGAATAVKKAKSIAPTSKGLVNYCKYGNMCSGKCKQHDFHNATLQTTY